MKILSQEFLIFFFFKITSFSFVYAEGSDSPEGSEKKQRCIDSCINEGEKCNAENSTLFVQTASWKKECLTEISHSSKKNMSHGDLLSREFGSKIHFFDKKDMNQSIFSINSKDLSECCGKKIEACILHRCSK